MSDLQELIEGSIKQNIKLKKDLFEEIRQLGYSQALLEDIEEENKAIFGAIRQIREMKKTSSDLLENILNELSMEE